MIYNPLSNTGSVDSLIGPGYETREYEDPTGTLTQSIRLSLMITLAGIDNNRDDAVRAWQYSLEDPTRPSLSPTQADVADKIFAYLEYATNDEYARCLVLEGLPGIGKTTLIKHISAEIIEDGGEIVEFPNLLKTYKENPDGKVIVTVATPREIQEISESEEVAEINAHSVVLKTMDEDEIEAFVLGRGLMNAGNLNIKQIVEYSLGVPYLAVKLMGEGMDGDKAVQIAVQYVKENFDDYLLDDGGINYSLLDEYFGVFPNDQILEALIAKPSEVESVVFTEKGVEIRLTHTQGDIAKRIWFSVAGQSNNQKKRHVIIVGFDGVGKSTMLNHLALGIFTWGGDVINFSELKAGLLSESVANRVLVTGVRPDAFAVAKIGGLREEDFIVLTLKSMSSTEVSEYIKSTGQKNYGQLSDEQVVQYSLGIPHLATLLLGDGMSEENAVKIVSEFIEDNLLYCVDKNGKLNRKLLQRYLQIDPPDKVVAAIEENYQQG